MNGPRQPPRGIVQMPSVTPVARGMIITCGLLFLVATAFPRFAFRHLALHPLSLHPWQLVTAVFLHFEIWHLLFNALALWMFGAAVEGVLGRKRFALYCLACGVGANLVWQIAAWIGGSATPVLGISGVVFGLLYAYGHFFPDAIILAFFVFPMRARSFVWIFGGLEVWFLLTARGSNVAHLVHVAGAIIGMLYLSRFDAMRRLGTKFWSRFDLWRRSRHLRVIEGRKARSPFLHDEDGTKGPPRVN